jgi:hypothetical protein
MKRSIFSMLSIMLVMVLTSFVPLSKFSWLSGEWIGVKYQVNAERGWKTNLTIDTKSKIFTIRYPELNCKGHLELVKLTRSQAILTEKIDEGPCLSDGYIIISKVSDQYISFTCLRDNNQRLASYCTLERQEK